ncbi:FkbM family methyltransferase [Bradyrhizobium sp. USDA 4486]
MGLVKNLVKAELSRRGLQLTRMTAENGSAFDVVSALIERSILLDRSGAVLQIGANDAVLTDPVCALIRKYELRALLVEPLPDVFERLARNVSEFKNIKLANVAVGRSAGLAKIYRINPSAPGMPDWIGGTATFNREVLLKHKRAPEVPNDIYESSIEELSVPVVTIGDLLSEHKDLGRVSIVHIDTEGFDYEVIKSLLAASLRPDVISYEHKHLSLADQVECRTQLSGLGYSFFSNDHDTVAQLSKC